jgi:type I restriction enzyme S subunit
MRDGWVETSLGEIAEVVGGGTPSTTIGEYWDGDIVWLTPTEITSQDGTVVSDSIRKITDLGFKNSGAQMLPRDSVILTSRASVGFVALSGKELCTNQGFQSLIPKPSVLSKFLMFWIQQNRPEFESRSAGSTFKEISKSNVKSIKLQLPPLPEQKRIVDLISSVDSYIEALEQQLGSVRSASNAHLEKIVSAFSDDWREVTLGEVLEISRGGSPRPIQEYLTDSEDGINWVKIADATRSEKYIYSTLQKIKREGISRSREVFTGDFILSNSMSFGRPYIMRTDGCIHDGWLLLSKVSSNFDEDFLYNLLNSDYVQRQFESLAAGSGVRNLNIEVVKKVKVKIPTIHAQKELASVINE